MYGILGALVVIDGKLFVAEVADERLIELRISEITLCTGTVGLIGSTVVPVPDGVVKVGNVLGGRETEGILPPDEIPTVDTLKVGIPGVFVFTPTATTGTVTGATVGAVMTA